MLHAITNKHCIIQAHVMPGAYGLGGVEDEQEDVVIKLGLHSKS